MYSLLCQQHLHLVDAEWR